ncbi:hypothetical protein [Erythrobacter sp. YT30]|uniref:hypothetical protein n=1 Tax=Erythrobacter sp. YT30 TaxID=1735012 RepID=UPI00076DD262|nr:hypothetical protein [Erythrobacter sp. YT30]KWV92681.1 hypothetical protein AUC45_00440 [Erythrobacter sp. YT30]
MAARRIYSSGHRDNRFGHYGYLDFGTSRVVDNQEEVLQAVRTERARRDLYMNCELAGSAWEYHAA